MTFAPESAMNQGESSFCFLYATNLVPISHIFWVRGKGCGSMYCLGHGIYENTNFVVVRGKTPQP